MAEIHPSNHITTTPPPTISPTITKPCYPPIIQQQQPSPSPSPPPPTPTPSSSINFMVLLAAIVCAFLCALGLNTMLKCVVQCAGRVLTEPMQWIASRRINSGLKKREMVALPTSTYSSCSSSSSSSSSNCAICLTDFSDGDKIRFLPKCNHRFHVVCIDKWLLSHSSCPTCRNFLKSNASSSSHSFHIVLA